MIDGPMPRAARDGDLVVDGGRTGVRLGRVGRAGVEVLGTGPGLPLIAAPDGVAHVTEAVAALVERHAPPGTDRGGTSETRALAAGLSGVFEAMDLAAGLANGLATRLRLTEVVLGSDVLTSHLGALDGAPGVVAAVGTGTVVLGIDGQGAWHRVDGWGPWVGDHGSGVDVGRRGLVAAMAAADARRGGSPALAEAARRRFGPLDRLPARIYADANPTALVASFCPDVAAAARHGDEVAQGIWVHAADAVADAIVAAAEAVFADGPVAVSWAGSLLELEDLLREPVRSRLRDRHPDLVLRPPVGDALQGGAQLLARAQVLSGHGLAHVRHA